MKVAHNLEAEASVLGAVLVHPRKFIDVAPLVSADDFFHPAHRAIFEALSELDAGSKPIDTVTVVEQMHALETFEKLNSAGGAEFLTDLMSRVVTVENVAYHARIVRSKAERRRTGDAARAVVDMAMDEDTDDEEFAATAETRLLEMHREARDEDKANRIDQVLHRAIRVIERRYEQRDTPGALGITTGFIGLDSMTTGLQPGELWIVAARPSMGKSAFAGAMILAAAASKHPYPSLVFSLEMSDESLAERMIASDSRVGLQKLRTGRIERDEWKKIIWSSGELAGRAIWIDPRRTLNIGEIRSRARRWRLGAGASERPCIIVVDYLQLISSMNRGGETRDRQQEIAAISRGLKLLAGEIGGAVIALAQLNRKCEERTDKRPMLSDLRESGAIEQDADVIAFIYRDEFYHPQTDDKGIAEVIVSKQRNGPIGVVRVGWEAEIGKFVNLKGEG